MANLKKQYNREDLTVIWQPDLCIHSKNCFNGLPNVFNPANRPWVNLEAATMDHIRKQVDACPSGALSYMEDIIDEKNVSSMVEKTHIDISDNGPILIKGPVLVNYKGKKEVKDTKTIALCRCGFSSNKPYCDGSHKEKGFID